MRASMILSALAALTVTAASVAQGADKPNPKQIERGRYLLIVGQCSDCHTHEYAPRDGKVPEKDWLLGSPLGFRGPWGTTYATNLRLSLSRMTEDQWVAYAKALKVQPPMPWFNLNKWADADLRAFYQYVRQLGPVGKPAPAPLTPDKTPPQPYIQWPAPPKKK
ncbi:MAG TPA: cytochrome C [Burkholderiales bacterium]